MLSVILLSVVALASILQMNKFLQEARANTTTFTPIKSFILQAMKRSECSYDECHFAKAHGTG